MARLFIALEIPEAIALKLSMLQGGIPGARWMTASDYHITLRFMGEVDPGQEEQLREELSRVHHQPLTISIKGVGIFGSKNPRAIFATIEPTDALMQLQKQLERTMQLIGLEPEHRKFTPHITLARLNRCRIASVELFCVDHNLTVREEFIASGFALYSAKGSTGGGPYVIEEHYDFEG